MKEITERDVQDALEGKGTPEVMARVACMPLEIMRAEGDLGGCIRYMRDLGVFVAEAMERESISMRDMEIASGCDAGIVQRFLRGEPTDVAAVERVLRATHEFADDNASGKPDRRGQIN
jgi:hypothetical protein